MYTTVLPSGVTAGSAASMTTSTGAPRPGITLAIAATPFTVVLYKTRSPAHATLVNSTDIGNVDVTSVPCVPAASPTQIAARVSERDVTTLVRSRVISAPT